MFVIFPYLLIFFGYFDIFSAKYENGIQVFCVDGNGDFSLHTGPCHRVRGGYKFQQQSAKQRIL